MDKKSELDALRQELKKETDDYVNELDRQAKAATSALETQTRNRLLEGYEQMKEICANSDKRAFEFFDRQIGLWGEEGRESAERVLRDQLDGNRRQLQHYKENFLSTKL